LIGLFLSIRLIRRYVKIEGHPIEDILMRSKCANIAELVEAQAQSSQQPVSKKATLHAYTECTWNPTAPLVFNCILPITYILG